MANMKFLCCLPAFLVGILLLLQFGSCGPTARPCCEEDDHRNSKIMGLLGVLAGVFCVVNLMGNKLFYWWNKIFLKGSKMCFVSVEINKLY